MLKVSSLRREKQEHGGGGQGRGDLGTVKEDRFQVMREMTVVIKKKKKKFLINDIEKILKCVRSV